MLTTTTLSPHPAYAGLTLTLALTGIGVGTTLVPVTASALSAVPAERSGMAASAANTSREIGAVAGVSVLGALVIGQLLDNFTVAMLHYQIPLFYRNLAVSLVLTGGIHGGASSVGGAALGEGKLVAEMTSAADSAFYTGLHAALFLSAFLVFAAGLFAFWNLGRKYRATAPRHDSRAGGQAGVPGYPPPPNAD
jgi:hypothetical protein